jgi:hypothetical protein
VVAAFPVSQKAGGIAAAGHAETSARLVQVAVNGVLGDAQSPGDLLGMEMFCDQPEAFPLARGKPFYRQRVVFFAHERRGKCRRRLSSIPLVNPVTNRD